MNHLEGGHAHECLLVPVVQVLRHVAVVDALHERVEHAQCHRGIAGVTRQLPELGRIAGYAQYVSVQRGNVTARL